MSPSGTKCGAGHGDVGEKRRSVAVSLGGRDAAYPFAAAGFDYHPNLPEAAALLGASHAQTEQEMLEQGRALRALGCEAVLMKGGHLMMHKAPTGSLLAMVSSVLPHQG